MKTARIRVSSKGQVVIPAWVRETLNLRTGDELILRMDPEPQSGFTLSRRPTAEEIEAMLAPAYKWFEETGIDLVEELHEARRKARLRERTRRRS